MENLQQIWEVLAKLEIQSMRVRFEENRGDIADEIDKQVDQIRKLLPSTK